jgi:hypothetical protein
MIVRRRITGLLFTAAVLGACAPAAQAQDFFANLFGGFAPPQRMMRAMPFASPMDEVRTPPPAARPAVNATRVAYCVRTCDGRYFPVPGGDDGACNSFCPASETKVFYGGGTIDDATTSRGQSYSDLPNAFRFRKEIVDNCTCNGKDAFGLAKVDIAEDKTLRKGDIVAGPDGLVIANGRVGKRNNVASFSPASPAIQAKFATRLPVVASE